MNWVSIGSGNGLSSVRRQAITWTNAVLLSIGLLRTNFSGIRIGIPSISFKKMQLKLSSTKMAAILSMGIWVNEIGPWRHRRFGISVSKLGDVFPLMDITCRHSDQTSFKIPLKVIGFRSGFSGRDISSVYLWCWWQGTKVERLDSTSKLWLIA